MALLKTLSVSKKILITGVSGFVGTNLCSAFYNEFELFGLDITTNSMLPVKRIFSWNQTGQLPEIDIIIHLAGKAHDTSNTAAEQEYFDVNLGLTQKIFDHFLKSEATKFIFFSSVKAVADSVEGVLTEETKPNPQTPYGRSKYAAEQYILGSKLPPNKNVYILRPCMIHGPGNKGNLNLLYQVVKKGIPWPLGAFTNQRSFISIDNVVFILKQLITHSVPPGICNLADDEPISTNTLIQLIAGSTGRKAKIWNLPPRLVHTMAKAGTLLHLPLNTERLKKLTESYVVSNTLIKKNLVVNNLPLSAIAGMKNTLDSFNKIGSHNKKTL